MEEVETTYITRMWVVDIQRRTNPKEYYKKLENTHEENERALREMGYTYGGFYTPGDPDARDETTMNSRRDTRNEENRQSKNNRQKSRSPPPIGRAPINGHKRVAHRSSTINEFHETKRRPLEENVTTPFPSERKPTNGRKRVAHRPTSDTSTINKTLEPRRKHLREQFRHFTYQTQARQTGTTVRRADQGDRRRRDHVNRHHTDRHQTDRQRTDSGDHDKSDSPLLAKTRPNITVHTHWTIREEVREEAQELRRRTGMLAGSWRD